MDVRVRMDAYAYAFEFVYRDALAHGEVFPVVKAERIAQRWSERHPQAFANTSAFMERPR